MCCDCIKNIWKLFKDNIKKLLIKLGDIPLCRVVGNRDYYGKKIQIPYDMSKTEAEEEIAASQERQKKDESIEIK